MNRPPRKAPPPRFTIVQQRPDRRPLITAVLSVLWIASLVGAWIGAERHAAPRLPAITAELDEARAELHRWRSQAESLAQREATLSRSDQISRAANKEIVELEFPRDTTIVAVLREERVIFPRGDTRLLPGDEVLALVTPDSEGQVQSILTDR